MCIPERIISPFPHQVCKCNCIIPIVLSLLFSSTPLNWKQCLYPYQRLLLLMWRIHHHLLPSQQLFPPFQFISTSIKTYSNMAQEEKTSLTRSSMIIHVLSHLSLASPPNPWERFVYDFSPLLYILFTQIFPMWRLSPLLHWNHFFVKVTYGFCIA